MLRNIILNNFSSKIQKEDLSDSFFDLRCYNVYVYGSLVYGTNTKNSDIDLIVISDINGEFKSNKIDVTSYTKETFESLLKNQEITAIECIFLNSDFILKKELSFNYEVDLNLLRHSFSSKASNSYVKAKKKIILKDEDSYIGLKSLYHCFRIYDFGIQLAKFKKIINYQTYHHVLDHLYSLKFENWEMIESLYKKEKNNLHSTFKSLTSQEFRKSI